MNAKSWHHAVVIGAAALVAVVSARPYAGGWNDGSRLATVEALVDHGDWSVDRSIFVDVPQNSAGPYRHADATQNGTNDLLWIHGRYYSDKSPLPAALMAGEYWLAQKLCGLTARADPARFVYLMTLLSSGLAYVVAVWCVFRLGAPLQLPVGWRFALAAAFAVTTIAPVYAQHVNNHIVLLAIAAALSVELFWISAGAITPARAIIVGLLMGFGYSVDLGVGPVLFGSTALLMAFRLRRHPAALVLAALASLPGPLVHHALNYSIGGTLGPANAVPSYLAWPGSPFTAKSMTGGWHHPSVTRFVLYSLDMIVGKRGILGHDLALCLAVVAIPTLWRVSRRERPELLHALGWSVGAWLLYGATSTNSSGVCCSIRWLAPMLAPGFFLLALVQRDVPRWRPDFLLLSGWGVVYCGAMVLRGPWREVDPRVNWLLVGGAALSWLALAVRRRMAIHQTQVHGSRSAPLGATSQTGHAA